MKRKRALFFALVSLFCTALCGACAAQGEGVPITITTGDVVVNATLNDSRASQDFIRTLPRSLSMSRLYDREYYATLPEALRTEGEALHREYAVGDVALWPSRNYFGILFSMNNPDLGSPIVKLGKVNSDLAVFENMPPDVEMRFAPKK